MQISPDLLSSFGNYYFRFHSLNNEYEYIHPRLLELLGYTLEEINVITIQKMIKHIDRSYETRDEFGAGVIAIREVSLGTKDGSEIWFAEYSQKRKDENGRIVGTEGYFRRNDILGESTAEGRTLADSFTRILKEIPDTAFICDKDSILAATPEFMRRLELSPGVLRNKVSLSEVFRPDVTREIVNAFAGVQTNVPVEIPDFVLGRNDLETSICIISSLKVLKSQYFLIRFEFNRYVSRETGTDALLIPAPKPEEIPVPAPAPSPAAESGHFKLYRKKTADLLTKIAHDVKAELSVITSFCRMLELEEMSLSPEEQSRIINSIAVKSRSVLDLHQDLMDYSRLELGVLQYSGEIISVGNTINEELERLSSLFRQKRIAINYHSVPGLFVNAPRDLFTKMVNHILVNAHKFCLPDGKVSVELTDNKTEISMKFTNSGTVPPVDTIQMFNRGIFGYTSPGTDNETGNGMGLKIVYAIVKLLQGKIVFTAETGTVCVELIIPKGE